MANILNKINIIDVESTCWKRGPDDGQKSEIIEIGICVVDVVNLAIVSKKNIIIKPEFSEVSEFCTQITSITPDMVENGGILFKDALYTLKSKYDIKNRLWASWGDYDRKQFERVCELHAIRYPFGPTHLNIKNLFAIYPRSRDGLCFKKNKLQIRRYAPQGSRRCLEYCQTPLLCFGKMRIQNYCEPESLTWGRQWTFTNQRGETCSFLQIRILGMAICRSMSWSANTRWSNEYGKNKNGTNLLFRGKSIFTNENKK